MSYDITLEDTDGSELYWRNMTSNVAPMWRHAGLNLAEWDERTAADLINPLRLAVAHMIAHPDQYEPMRPRNGWGSYESCLRFLAHILDACREHETATIHVDY